MRLYLLHPMRISLISLRNMIGKLLNNRNLSKSERFYRFQRDSLQLLPPSLPLELLPQPVLSHTRQDHQNLLFHTLPAPSRDGLLWPQIAAFIIFQNHRLNIQSATTDLPESFLIMLTGIVAGVTSFTVATIGNNKARFSSDFRFMMENMKAIHLHIWKKRVIKL